MLRRPIFLSVAFLSSLMVVAQVEHEILLRSGNGTQGGSDALVKIVDFGGTGCRVPTAGDFQVAQGPEAQRAFIIDAWPEFYVWPLPSDASAQWISVGRGAPPHSALYAVAFSIDQNPIGHVELDLAYAADNKLHGAYVNGHLVSTLGSCSGEDFWGEKIIAGVDITDIVQPGENWLYLNLYDQGDIYVSGLIFSARIVVRGTAFQRGDANLDRQENIADAICVLGFLFGGAGDPSKEKVRLCFDAADANDDGQVNIADAIKIISYLFAQSGPLPEPFNTCGVDPTPDGLDCDQYSPCE